MRQQSADSVSAATPAADSAAAPLAGDTLSALHAQVDSLSARIDQLAQSHTGDETWDKVIEVAQIVTALASIGIAFWAAWIARDAARDNREAQKERQTAQGRQDTAREEAQERQQRAQEKQIELLIEAQNDQRIARDLEIRHVHYERLVVEPIHRELAAYRKAHLADIEKSLEDLRRRGPSLPDKTLNAFLADFNNDTVAPSLVALVDAVSEIAQAWSSLELSAELEAAVDEISLALAGEAEKTHPSSDSPPDARSALNLAFGKIKGAIMAHDPAVQPTSGQRVESTQANADAAPPIS